MFDPSCGENSRDLCFGQNVEAPETLPPWLRSKFRSDSTIKQSSVKLGRKESRRERKRRKTKQGQEG